MAEMVTPLTRASVRIESAKPQIGGIVHVGKQHLCDPGTIAAVRDALENRGVLVFPQLHLTDAEQLAFTDLLGPRVNFTKRVPGSGGGDDPDIYKISLDKQFNMTPEYVLGTFFWHIDGVTIDQPLPKATLLSARALSPTGGQTEFANTYAAYEALPEEDKAALEGLMVIHRMEASMKPVFREVTDDQVAVWRDMATWMTHPLVWKHQSGRKSLVLGSHADEIIGRDVAHGRSLMARLTEWVAQPQFTYRHEWKLGDLVIWDNCGVMHRVVPYDADTGRSMHRTTIGGGERIAA